MREATKTATLREVTSADHATPPTRRRGEPPAGAPLTITEPRIARGPSPEMIAARAYEIFLERGAEHGDDVGDWLRAEQELVARSSAAPTIES